MAVSPNNGPPARSRRRPWMIWIPIVGLVGLALALFLIPLVDVDNMQTALVPPVNPSASNTPTAQATDKPTTQTSAAAAPVAPPDASPVAGQTPAGSPVAEQPLAGSPVAVASPPPAQPAASPVAQGSPQPGQAVATAPASVSLFDVVAQPAPLYGQALATSGALTEMIGPRAFRISTDRLGRDEGLLVLSSTRLPPLPTISAGSATGQEPAVRVVGDLRLLRLDEVQREIGYDLDDALYRSFVGQPVLIARTVTLQTAP